MKATQVRQWESFIALLAAPGRSLEIRESGDVYGWLVGSWELEVLHYKAVDVSAQRIRGEAHFGWVLEGRAIQDVWITPRPEDRSPPRQDQQYVRHDLARLGSHDSGVAHSLDQPRDRPWRAASWAQDR